MIKYYMFFYKHVIINKKPKRLHTLCISFCTIWTEPFFHWNTVKWWVQAFTMKPIKIFFFKLLLQKVIASQGGAR